VQYRADIDGLRALAVVSVLGFHLFPRIAHGGFVGVDVFFVISGFLISSVLMNDIDERRPIFLRFYSRRVRRIFPALIVVLAAAWAAGWLVLLPGEYTRLGKHVAGGAGFIANLLDWNEAGYFDQAANTKPLLHLWSLGVEEQFYLLWPLLIVTIWRTRFREALFVILLAGSFALSLVTVYLDPVAAFYSPINRFWELLAGAALAFAARDARTTAWWQSQTLARHLCSLLGVSLIVVAVVRFDSAAVFPGWKVLAPVAGSALVIAAGSSAWVNAKVFSRRPIVWVGLISYPLYLWHWPLFAFVRVTSGDPSSVARLMIGAASIVLAAATFWLVEQPIRSRPARPPMVIGLCVSMTVAASLGLATLWSKGYPRRLPNAVGKIAEFSYDSTGDYRGHQCLLFPDRNERVLGPDCLDSTPSKMGQNEIALWGDSHAAQLYSGFRRRYQDAFRISQLTAAACPPLLDDPGRWPSCRALTRAAFDVIVARKPAIVVLGAQWINYDWRSLPDTIGRLRAAGIGRIVVVGEVPLWDGPFPEILARVVLKDRPRFRVPERTSARLIQSAFEIDDKMRLLARQESVIYESTIGVLCNEEGCLARAGDSGESIVTFDDAHLTAAGSQYLVEHFHDIGEPSLAAVSARGTGSGPSR
jgi:peptidoglycan/LPS O-acetylase OafA/YrhL